MLSLRSGCMFVPPDVLESLARARVEPARLSIAQSVQSRVQRTGTVVPITTLAAGAIPTGIAPPGQGPRKVYDCQNTWVKRVLPLARGEGDPVSADAIVNKAYDFVDTVRGYFATQLNRNSYDNVGSDIIVNVHFGVNYMNAFWDGDELTFGDGDGNIFVNFAGSLDVVAHEFGHGVVQTTAGLIYQNEAGALNESFADIFGSAITQHAENQTAATADWLIGDEIMGPTLLGEALRSMAYPGTAFDNTLMGKDNQRGHMDDFYSGPLDNGGVHWNSGIPNKAYYIVAKQIGTAAATRIWYQGLQNLWPTAGFNDAVGKIAESAGILVANGQVPLGSKQIVRGAFSEVGLPY